MLPITVMLAVDKGICCWLLTAAETLGVSAWGLSSRNALCCLPHSLGSFARQMKHAGFCSGTGSLQGAVPSGGSAAQAITALGETSSHNKPPLFPLGPRSLQSSKLWLIRTSFIYFLHAKGHSWPCLFLNPLLQLCRMKADFSLSEMWLLCKSRVDFFKVLLIKWLGIMSYGHLASQMRNLERAVLKEQARMDGLTCKFVLFRNVFKLYPKNWSIKSYA